MSYSQHSSDSDRLAVIQDLVAARAGRDWCLFLDRDGVINRRVIGDYVRSWQDFEFLPGATRALKQLRLWAPQLVVVTNQQGVGKGLMNADDVDAIHRSMREQLLPDGVEIDGFEVCPHLESIGCACRKPRPGLVLNWLKQHPNTDASLSVVVGDSRSDLEMAYNVSIATGGCATIEIGSGSLGWIADASFDSLQAFAQVVADAIGGKRS